MMLLPAFVPMTHDELSPLLASHLSLLAGMQIICMLLPHGFAFYIITFFSLPPFWITSLEELCESYLHFPFPHWLFSCDLDPPPPAHHLACHQPGSDHVPLKSLCTKKYRKIRQCQREKAVFFYYLFCFVFKPV